MAAGVPSEADTRHRSCPVTETGPAAGSVQSAATWPRTVSHLRKAAKKLHLMRMKNRNELKGQEYF